MLRSTDSRILVTGGAGFIGSALVWELNRRGCENIVVSDRLCTDEKWRNLVPLKFHDYIDGGDLEQRVRTNPESLGKFDVILHLGACSATTEKDADYLMRNNYEFTKVLAEWSLSKDSRFVYASSAATYGDGSLGMDDTMTDLHRLRPLNMYGYSKHLFDLHAQRTGMAQRIVGMKYFNVYGPNEDHKADMRSVVHKAYGQILQTGKVQLFKSDRPNYKDPPSRLRSAGRWFVQSRLRRGQHLGATRHRHLCRTWQGAEHRVRADARASEGEVSILHLCGHRPPASVRLCGATFQSE
jgi:ADP-L-glycero-D-manno-heptose 6-epimerase